MLVSRLQLRELASIPAKAQLFLAMSTDLLGVFQHLPPPPRAPVEISLL